MQDETVQDQDTKKSELALVIARGGSIAAWASKNGVPRRTAFFWAKDPKVRKDVEEYHRHALEQAFGRMNSRAKKAADGIYKLAQMADSESVRLSAFRSVLADQMTIAKFSALERRVVEVEEMLEARLGDDESAGLSAGTVRFGSHAPDQGGPARGSCARAARRPIRLIGRIGRIGRIGPIGRIGRIGRSADGDGIGTPHGPVRLARAGRE